VQRLNNSISNPPPAQSPVRWWLFNEITRPSNSHCKAEIDCNAKEHTSVRNYTHIKFGNGGLDRISYYHIIYSEYHIFYPILSYIQTRLDRIPPVGAKKILHWLFTFIPNLNKRPRKFLPKMIPYGGLNGGH
jgi:hypothetical protein